MVKMTPNHVTQAVESVLKDSLRMSSFGNSERHNSSHLVRIAFIDACPHNFPKIIILF